MLVQQSVYKHCQKDQCIYLYISLFEIRKYLSVVVQGRCNICFVGIFRCMWNLPRSNDYLWESVDNTFMLLWNCMHSKERSIFYVYNRNKCNTGLSFTWMRARIRLNKFSANDGFNWYGIIVKRFPLLGTLWKYYLSRWNGTKATKSRALRNCDSKE